MAVFVLEHQREKKTGAILDNGFTFEYIQTRRLLVSLQLSKQAKQLETLRRQKNGSKVYHCLSL
jgi:hypothetical protein